MKPPGFWKRPPGLAARLLQPASLAYGAFAAARMRRPGQRSGCPVICVGNVTLGGSGKTPTAIAVAALLRGAGQSPAFLTRGYGGSEAGPMAVAPARHDAGEVGDEALLLARQGPTVVSRDRPAGARLCTELGADVVVMDDGLQNPSLAKDLTIAVFDGAAGIGNGLVFPSGPLRAPVAAQLPLIDAAVIVGPDATGLAHLLAGVPVLRASLIPDAEVAAALRGRRVLAFAGIGRPEKFFATLRMCGADVVRTIDFADHHIFTAAEIARLCGQAEGESLTLVTTEKDAVRLDALRDADPRMAAIAVLPVSLDFERPADMAALLTAALQRRLSPDPSAGGGRGA